MSVPGAGQFERGRDRPIRVFVALLGLFCFAGLARVAATIGLRVPLDSNEGWNAYHALAAMSAGALYPPEHGFLFNDYPPLSFYVVGALGALIGDQIVAGRIVSLLALLAVSAGIALCLRAMKAACAASLFAPLLFVASMLVFTDYVAMDDPQLLAHAVAMAGLVILLRAPRAAPAVIVAALLMTTAGFIKHNLIAQPAAMAVWLAIYDRRSAARFVLSGVAFALAGLSLFRLSYGISLLSELNSARTYSFALLGQSLSQWLVWGGGPMLVLAVLYLRRRDDSSVVLCALYAVVSVVVGTVFSGGAGVDTNIWFDAAIASALGAGLALDRLGSRAAEVAAIACACAVPLAIGLAVNADESWTERDFWLHPMAQEAAQSRQDIALLESRPGPALCEMLSLCYWAGKTAEVDVFNLGQAYATGARRDGDMLRLIAQRHFGLVQFDSMTDFALTPRIRRELLRDYRIVRTDDDGVFLVPVRPLRP